MRISDWSSDVCSSDLNIKSIGPNLILAPDAEPTDGKFEVVLLKHSDRKVFSAYLRQLRHPVTDGHLVIPWQIVTVAHQVIIRCDSQTIHVDDELVTLKKGKMIEITIRPGIVEIIT